MRLVLVDSRGIVGENLPVLRPQALVVCGFAQGINHVVDRAVIPNALIQLGLQTGQFLFGALKAISLFLSCGSGAVNVIEVIAHLHEDMGVPIALEILVAVMTPVLGKQASGNDQ